MSNKTSFSSVLAYGIEIFLLNIGLLIVSGVIGGILSIWLSGYLPSSLELVSSIGGFMFFTILSYVFLIPALIYKLMADAVSKGLSLNSVRDNPEDSQTSEDKDVERNSHEIDSSEKSLTEQYEYEYDKRVHLAVLISIVIVGILSLII